MVQFRGIISLKTLKFSPLATTSENNLANNFFKKSKIFHQTIKMLLFVASEST